MKKVMCAVSALAGILLVVAGIIFKIRDSVAISVIGGADGPTSIFLAGKVGNGFTVTVIFIGIILILPLACAGICYIRKNRKNSSGQT